jgi:hypothetical protein
VYHVGLAADLFPHPDMATQADDHPRPEVCEIYGSVHNSIKRHGVSLVPGRESEPSAHFTVIHIPNLRGLPPTLRASLLTSSEPSLTQTCSPDGNAS